MRPFAKLRGEITAHGIEHSDFARGIGLSKSAVSQRLNGHKQWRLSEIEIELVRQSGITVRSHEILIPVYALCIQVIVGVDVFNELAQIIEFAVVVQLIKVIMIDL